MQTNTLMHLICSSASLLSNNFFTFLLGTSAASPKLFFLSLLRFALQLLWHQQLADRQHAPTPTLQDCGRPEQLGQQSAPLWSLGSFATFVLQLIRYGMAMWAVCYCFNISFPQKIKQWQAINNYTRKTALPPSNFHCTAGFRDPGEQNTLAIFSAFLSVHRY